MDKINLKVLGRHGEELAVSFLEGKGYRILERNFKNKLGEIDLIAARDGGICFVEVKTRRSFKFGMPYESVHARKQFKLIQLAQAYLKFKFNSVDLPARFDVISIYQDPSGQAHIEHVPHAFGLNASR